MLKTCEEKKNPEYVCFAHMFWFKIEKSVSETPLTMICADILPNNPIYQNI